MSAASSVKSVSASLLSKDLPHGFLAATAEATAKAPTFGDIRRGSYGQEGWNERVQMERRRSSASGGRPGVGRRGSSGLSDGSGKKMYRKGSSGTPGEVGENQGGLAVPFPTLAEEPTEAGRSIDGQRQSKDFAVVGPSEKAQIDPLDGNEKDIKAVPVGHSSSEEKRPHSEVREKHHNRGKKQEPAPHLLSARDRAHSSGYIPPPKIPWTTSTLVGTKAFLKWFITPFGFLVTIYGLNVVAWGGMLFLLLCNAAPAMCSPDLPSNGFDGCNDIGSPRRIWIEIDSQILNALFCVTGFGLVPWRFRDLWYLLRWRLCSEKRYGREQKLYGLRVLAGFHRNWFRLPGSDTLDELTPSEYERSINKNIPRADSPTSGASLEATNTPDKKNPGTTLDLPTSDPRLPLPLKKTPLPPLTSIRAPPTPLWKLDFFIWCQVWNTFFQICLSTFMWHMNRYERPPWSTGLFVALACGVAGVGGWVSFKEGKKVKRVEGVGDRGSEGPGEEAVDGHDLEMNRVRAERVGQK